MSGDYLTSRLAAVEPAHVVEACNALINRARLLYEGIKGGKDSPQARKRFEAVVEALLNLGAVVQASPQVPAKDARDVKAGIDRVLEAAKELAALAHHRT